MNPLLITLNESRAGGDGVDAGLLKMMGAFVMDRGPVTIALAIGWELSYGSPTWEKLRAWAQDMAANPAWADYMGLLHRHHEEVMASLTPEELARIEPYLE